MTIGWQNCAKLDMSLHVSLAMQHSDLTDKERALQIDGFRRATADRAAAQAGNATAASASEQPEAEALRGRCMWGGWAAGLRIHTLLARESVIQSQVAYWLSHERG